MARCMGEEDNFSGMSWRSCRVWQTRVLEQAVTPLGKEQGMNKAVGPSHRI